MMNFWKIACALLLAVVNGFGQAQISAGDIEGTITDSTGAVLAGAVVSVTNTDTGLTRTARTEDIGTYRLFLVPVGIYEIRIEAAGFGPHVRRPIQVTVGQTVTVDAQLSPTAISQEITVIQAAPLLQLEKTQQADTITAEQVAHLPINKRNFLDLTLLTPAVTDSKGLIMFPLPMTPTSGLSFLGQSGRSNNVSVDGFDNNEGAVGAVRATISQEAVHEFQINRSNFSAESGRSAGGLINIVSKSGTNQFRANIFAFLRHQKLDARNAFAFGPNGADVDPPFNRVQTGFTLGGPIQRNRTFVFLSYEGLRQRESNFVSFMENTRFFEPTTSQRSLLTALSASPSPALRQLGAGLTQALTTSPSTYPETVRLLESNSGVFPFRNNDNNALLRLDHKAGASDQVFGRLSFADTDTTGVFGGLTAPSRGTNHRAQDYGAAVAYTRFFEPARVNEFRFQFASRDYDALPADALGPEITINGVALLGRSLYLPAVRNEKRFQWVDNYSQTAGKHTIKAGVDFHYLPFNTTSEIFFSGRFIFGEAIPLGLVIDSAGGPGTSANVAAALAASGQQSLIPAISAPITSLQSFNLGLPLVYQQGFGNPVTKLRNKMIGTYFQDSFRATRNLSLNVGLRYDIELHEKPVRRDKNNFAPRFGFSYGIGEGTIVRGGYGLYYAPVFEAVTFIARVLDGTQITQVLVPLTGFPQLGITTTSAQVWGRLRQTGVLGQRKILESDIASLGLRPGVTPPVISGVRPDLASPYSQQGSFGIEHQLTNDLSVSANYLVNRGVKILRGRNINLRVSGANAFGPAFAPLDPRILQNNSVESSGNSIYHGGAFTLSKRYSNRTQFNVSYTFSKAIDDTTDFTSDLQAANQLDLRNERSLSGFDQRHRLAVSGVVDTVFGIRAAPIVTYGSGRPFNLLLGFDANGDTNANTDRPPSAGRNTGRGPDFVTLDFRLAKDFSLGDTNRSISAIVEAFNIFNRVNFSGVNTVVGLTPLSSHHVKGRKEAGPTDPLGFTSAFDPRQIQVGIKVRF